MSDELKIAVNNLCSNIERYRKAQRLLQICKVHNLEVVQPVTELLNNTERMIYLSIELVNVINESNNT